MMSQSNMSETIIPLPTWRATASEVAGLLELFGLAWRLPSLLREPRGDGAPVLVLPGFGADDRSTWPLRRFLSMLGHDVLGWSLGTNRAKVPDAIEEIGTRVERTAAEAGRPLSLVGSSRGGYIAREVGRDHPKSDPQGRSGGPRRPGRQQTRHLATNDRH